MSPRRQQLSLDLFTAAVIASVAIALAGLTWRAALWLTRPAPVMAPIATVPVAGPLDVAPILALAPFGTPAAGAPVPTALPLELKGVLLTVPRSESVAMVAPPGGAAVSYRIGAAIPGGGAIDEIAIDHIVFAAGGRREMLSFPKPGAPASDAAPAPGAAPTTAPISPPPPPGGMPMAPPAAPAGALAASPQALLDSLGASPVNGGYRVNETLSPTMRQAGVQPGDVITRLNGQALGNGAADQQLLGQAARSGSVTVEVMRGDKKLTLAFPFR